MMAQLPPVRTREEAEQDAEFIRGCLMEAGRPDLAGHVVIEIATDGGWTDSILDTGDDDARVYHKAIRLQWPEYPCFDCWNAFCRAGADDQLILLDCDHVLPFPRSSRPLPVGAE